MSRPRSASAGSSRRQFLAASALTAASLAASDLSNRALANIPAAKRRGKPVKTLARIATICQQGNYRHTHEANRAHMLEVVDSALAEKPDLICIPETFTAAGVPKPLTDSAEPLDGPTISAFAEKARKGNCYIICPNMTREGKNIFNSAVVLDRSGRVTGVYHKACPVTTEPDYTVMENGVMPGSGFPVFDLDFGRVGIQICFDCGFPENWQKLADQGVHAVIWPSAYDGGFPLRAYAFLHHFWVISATNSGQARIIDPCGEILKETGSGTPVIHRTINTDYVVAHLDFNYGIHDRIKEKYGDRVDVRMWDPGSGHFIVEPTEDGITTKQLCQEFGLEPTETYFNRHRMAYRELKQGEKPKPQEALHGRRPQYGK